MTLQIEHQIEHQLPFQSLALVELEPRMKEDVLVICSLCFRCVNQALLTLLLVLGVVV